MSCLMESSLFWYGPDDVRPLFKRNAEQVLGYNAKTLTDNVCLWPVWFFPSFPSKGRQINNCASLLWLMVLSLRWGALAFLITATLCSTTLLSPISPSHSNYDPRNPAKELVWLVIFHRTAISQKSFFYSECRRVATEPYRHVQTLFANSEAWCRRCAIVPAQVFCIASWCVQIPEAR